MVCLALLLCYGVCLFSDPKRAQLGLNRQAFDSYLTLITGDPTAV